MAQTSPKTKVTNPKLPLVAVVVIGVAAVVGLVWGGVALFGSLSGRSTANHAEEVAAPLEKALADAGGTKTSSGGDAGRGADNLSPHYEATYYLSIDRAEAIALINRTAEANGYKLTHATPSNRGHLDAVADKYIDAWYFDITSKRSTFSDLQEGPIRLSIKIGNEDRPDPADHTTIGIGVQLPDVRR
ncbi:MAG TPA: hypothetical protein VJM32_03890 [Candidatus Saccharimonadales bacterium]|nr:hypothetical protein [Candidatus Saccharimonadales bacterium]